MADKHGSISINTRSIASIRYLLRITLTCYIVSAPTRLFLCPSSLPAVTFESQTRLPSNPRAVCSILFEFQAVPKFHPHAYYSAPTRLYIMPSNLPLESSNPKPVYPLIFPLGVVIMFDARAAPTSSVYFPYGCSTCKAAAD